MGFINDYNPNLPGSGSAMGQLTGAPIGGYIKQASAADQLRTESELEAITSRIYSLGNDAQGLASKLRDHADAVHGTVPDEALVNAAGNPTRCGQLGALHDALDRLASIQAELAAQASRNCTLA